MKDNHIKNILDNTPLADLSENELKIIRAHVRDCADCDRAYQAARVSALLLKQRAQEARERSLEVNPFFQTRVLAAWREQQATSSISGWRRMWNETGALVASMAAATAALAVLTFVTPSTEPVANQQAAGLVPYSAEAALFDQNQ